MIPDLNFFATDVSFGELTVSAEACRNSIHLSGPVWRTGWGSSQYTIEADVLLRITCENGSEHLKELGERFEGGDVFGDVSIDAIANGAKISSHHRVNVYAYLPEQHVDKIATQLNRIDSSGATPNVGLAVSKSTLGEIYDLLENSSPVMVKTWTEGHHFPLVGIAFSHLKDGC